MMMIENIHTGYNTKLYASRKGKWDALVSTKVKLHPILYQQKAKDTNKVQGYISWASYFIPQTGT